MNNSKHPVPKDRNVLLSILWSWKLIFRSIIFLSGLACIIIACVFGIIWIFRWTFPVTSVRITDQGAYILNVDNNKTVHWMFSSSELWANSGIPVKRGDVIEITASGRFNTSINNLYKYAESDTSTAFPWVGPDGLEQKDMLRPADRNRYAARIKVTEGKDTVPIGKLLMQVVKEGKPVEVRPHVNPLYVIGKRRTVQVEQDGILYFAVNEIPLDSGSRETYIVREFEDAAYCKARPVAQQERAWEWIQSKQDWDMWYEDNIGSILVSIAFE